jgi:ADP-ribosylglycohydrolase
MLLNKLGIMNFSRRNKKVALARWNRVHAKEKEGISSNSNSLIMKAAICGFLAGDGSVQKRKNILSLSNRFFPR